MSEQEEWAALLQEAVAIPETPADKLRRLLHLRRDVEREVPDQVTLLVRIDQTIRDLLGREH